MRLIRTAVWSIVLAASAAAPAFAELGGSGTSVEADRVSMKGALRITTSATFSVHEITTSFGTVVREYVSPADKVFAVSWHGPVIPDLKQMLGSYYGQYQQASATASHLTHRHFVVQQPGLIVQSSGRMRAFYGRAWAPALLPQNVSISEIQ